MGELAFAHIRVVIESDNCRRPPTSECDQMRIKGVDLDSCDKCAEGFYEHFGFRFLSGSSLRTLLAL